MVAVQYIGKKPSLFRPGEYVSDKERLIIGEPMPSYRRTVFPYCYDWITGEIGYLDFEHLINQEFGGSFLYLHTIGIEPQYTRHGHMLLSLSAL